MWQISSGRNPFYADYAENKKYDLNLIMDIKKGKREEMVKDTPIEYNNLYEGIY